MGSAAPRRALGAFATETVATVGALGEPQRRSWEGASGRARLWLTKARASPRSRLFLRAEFGNNELAPGVGSSPINEILPKEGRLGFGFNSRMKRKWGE